jgi:hypothetical protein
MEYLASPYSDPDPAVRQLRYEQVTIAAAELIRRGAVIFCPITHSHPLEQIGGLRGGWDFWQRQDIPFLQLSNAFHILQLPGWDKSEGVTAERAWWEGNRFAPVRFWMPNELGVLNV